MHPHQLRLVQDALKICAAQSWQFFIYRIALFKAQFKWI